jgi:hypothetical protein
MAYEYQAIAKTGDVIGGKTLSGFAGCAVCVNDSGTVAFVAQIDVGARRASRRRRKAMTALLEKAQAQMEEGSPPAACSVLSDAYLRLDGQREPLQDWFKGPAKARLVNMLEQTMAHLGFR